MSTTEELPYDGQIQWVQSVLAVTRNSPCLKEFERVAAIDAVAEYARICKLNIRRTAFDAANHVLKLTTLDASTPYSRSVALIIVKHWAYFIREDERIRKCQREEDYLSAVRLAVTIIQSSPHLGYVSKNDGTIISWPGTQGISCTLSQMSTALTAVFDRLSTRLPLNEVNLKYLVARLNASEKIREAALSHAENSVDDQYVDEEPESISIGPFINLSQLYELLCAYPLEANIAHILCTSTAADDQKVLAGSKFPLKFDGYFALRYARRRVPQSAQDIGSKSTNITSRDVSLCV